MELIKDKPYIAFAIALLIGIVGTHWFDATHYNHQAAVDAHETNIKEANLSLDFNTMVGQTKGQIDCSQLRENINIDYCRMIDDLRR